jgi:hypothetical protein
VLRTNNNFALPDGYQSVCGLGRQAPDNSPRLRVTLPDGSMINLGKAKNYGERDRSDFQYNEYVVPEPS